ncbi:MAG: metallophosphoesterase [Alicyclobacillus shizuokensis]|nr:metallophosphoesterase [Alicyclobacillus shizuokensis]
MHGPDLSFAVLSDLHFMAWKDTLAPVEWVPQVIDSLEDAVCQQPDFVVLNGDLTNGKRRDYDLAFQAIRQVVPCPVYCTMGNHEYYGFYEPEDYAPHPFSPERAQRRFLDYTGLKNIYYQVQTRMGTFLFLSCESYSPDLKDAGWLSDRQLEWLSKRLTSAPAGPVFTFVHQPVNRTVAKSEYTLVQSEVLRNILKTRPNTILFSGHTHCRMDRVDQLVRQNGTWFVGGGCPHGDYPQFRFVQVYTDRVVLRLRDCSQKRWHEEYQYVLSLPDLNLGS